MEPAQAAPVPVGAVFIAIFSLWQSATLALQRVAQRFGSDGDIFMLPEQNNLRQYKKLRAAKNDLKRLVAHAYPQFGLKQKWGGYSGATKIPAWPTRTKYSAVPDSSSNVAMRKNIAHPIIITKLANGPAAATSAMSRFGLPRL